MNLLFQLLNAIITLSLLIGCTPICPADNSKQLLLIKRAYPDHIKEVSNNSLTWTDDERINLEANSSATTRASPSLIEQLNQPTYPMNKTVICETYIPKNDSGRTRNEYFFRKMYGQNEEEVKNNLEIVYWMPHYFGNKYPIQITSINGINAKLKQISKQLELLVKKHPEFIKYLDEPGGAFYWRNIENSDRLSPHSFGIAIDINPTYANYWIWETGIKENKLKQLDVFSYKNRIPCEIVTIFENNGFIWGGKWQHYDTMHFEYRPELIMP